MEHFTKKDFAKARSEFLAAYALKDEPTVLFAIAQTYRFEGNYKEAIDWYKKFLADSQAAQDLRTEAQTYLSEAEARQRALDEARRKIAETGPTEADGKPAKMPTGSTTTPASPVRREPVDRHERRIPLGSKIAAGAAGVGLVVSIVLTKRGLDVEREFKDLGVAATKADADRVERHEDLINLSWGLTAAAAVTSVALYFVAPRRASHRKVVIAPSHDGGWTAAFTGRF
jgi:tetratricopeptide (TPR) repeat protein